MNRHESPLTGILGRVFLGIALAMAWNQQVDAFDVEGLASQLASTGTKYPLFTIGQNSGHYCLPNGKTQTQYPWGSKAGAPEPKVWQHDLFRQDRTPYDPHEITLFKEAIGRSR